jgi:Ni,Fe-hydrogenase maturation factor
LARFVEGTERAVFVDTVIGFAEPAAVVVLPGAEVAALADARYEHSAGLPYLLRMLPSICDGPLPEVVVVGVEGCPDEASIDLAAEAALRAAAEGGPAAP